jgi:hypothetical protein
MKHPIVTPNAEADGELLDEIAAPDPDGKRLLLEAAERLRLSARGDQAGAPPRGNCRRGAKDVYARYAEEDSDR